MRFNRQLAHAVAEDGIDQHAAAVARITADLRRREGVNPVLLEILADPRAPGVARERALGRLLGELDRPLRSRPATAAA
jgi:hypothetical protein